MLAWPVEELEVDKCRRAGWRSGTSFRGASSFSAEQLVSKHHTSALGHKTVFAFVATRSAFATVPQLACQSVVARVGRDCHTTICHVPDSSRARKGRRKAQAWMERNNSNKPPTFLGDNDVRRKASPTIIHIALRLHLSEHATTQSAVAAIVIMILGIPTTPVG